MAIEHERCGLDIFSYKYLIFYVNYLNSLKYLT